MPNNRTLEKQQYDRDVYVLRLAREKYYVGKVTRSRPLAARLREEIRGGSRAAKWVQRHPHRETIWTCRNVGPDAEHWVTLYAMYIHGWENVRGAGWTQCDTLRKPKWLDRYENHPDKARKKLRRLVREETIEYGREKTSMSPGRGVAQGATP